MDFFMTELGVPGSQLLLAAQQTLYMVFMSLFLGTVFGLIIAVTLVLTNPGGILKNSVVFNITNTIVNIVRSVPFIILMVFILLIFLHTCFALNISITFSTKATMYCLTTFSKEIKRLKN